ncbi:TerB family tellurite resistance protein [Aurantibacter crassamenti]|uniref:TerB family tellurite resistance protein n=1 Tax=Aurantibacter crassamenti TaxID=1837375 RepID=UPI00193A7248|nr:TerB family tellurite resistance protein [Aurantibacter crassamenti]MBM1106417.1 TerB family tellurite resistance protein [Aurantibacter crassamenti]
MSSYEEKLSILSEMIAFAQIDKTIKEPEFSFLLSVAAQLGIERETFDSLLKKSSKHVIPKSQADRILQFHRLVLLMNVDEEQDEVEVSRLHNIGLGMGLPPSAIQQVLSIMHQYPNKIVPPKVLINIFKAHYN